MAGKLESREAGKLYSEQICFLALSFFGHMNQHKAISVEELYFQMVLECWSIGALE